MALDSKQPSKNCDISGKLFDSLGFLGSADGGALATSVEMPTIDEITDQIIAAAIEVHKKFGPGLLESVYTDALGAELVAREFDVHISKPISLEHEGLHVHRPGQTKLPRRPPRTPR